MENWVVPSDMALNWFESLQRKMACGVLQGSILGPLLYTIIITYKHSTLCVLKEINNWIIQGFLQGNKDENVIVFGASEWLNICAQLPFVILKTTNQAIVMDLELNFNSHTKSVIKSAKYHLKNISRIEGLMCQGDLVKLLHEIILDYNNSVSTGMPKRWIRQLQLIQNAVALVLSKSRKVDQITAVLKSLHWLAVL